MTKEQIAAEIKQKQLELATLQLQAQRDRLKDALASGEMIEVNYSYQGQRHCCFLTGTQLMDLIK